MASGAMDAEIYRGLRALAEASFPKRCAVCGRVYETAADFLRLTTQIDDERSGLKQAIDDDRAVVELFRNCLCGSTLMDLFADRRDTSASGVKRRHEFDALLVLLMERGLSPQAARVELLKLLCGEESALLPPPRDMP